MAAAAPPPVAPPPAHPTSLGGVALQLAVGFLVGGLAVLILDLIVGLVLSGGRDPFSASWWPVNPLVIVVMMSVGWLGALVLGVRAIVTRQRGDLGAAAIVVALLPASFVVYLVGMVVAANWPWR